MDPVPSTGLSWGWGGGSPSTEQMKKGKKVQGQEGVRGLWPHSALVSRLVLAPSCSCLLDRGPSLGLALGAPSLGSKTRAMAAALRVPLFTRPLSLAAVRGGAQKAPSQVGRRGGRRCSGSSPGSLRGEQAHAGTAGRRADVDRSVEQAGHKLVAGERMGPGATRAERVGFGQSSPCPGSSPAREKRPFPPCRLQAPTEHLRPLFKVVFKSA